MTDSTAPTVLSGRYAIERKIARGGMADIFLAHDQVLERPVVIKMLLPQYAGDPAFVERFRREAKSAARLNHTNVVSVYDWGSHGDTFFMAMEYIEGQSLAEQLADNGRVPIDRALEIAEAAAAGLGFAHERGMVHRDVKPGNIMMTASGQVKVADFGIARGLDGSDSLTQTGNVMGTAAYFSPEQARGEVVDERSDLYSLGVVLFEMVTGERPFTGSSPLSVAYKHVGEAPPTAQSINPQVPVEVDRIIATLLAKDPAHRYANAEQLQQALRASAAVSNRPTRGRPRASSPRPRPRPRPSSLPPPSVRPPTPRAPNRSDNRMPSDTPATAPGRSAALRSWSAHRPDGPAAGRSSLPSWRWRSLPSCC